MAGLRGGASDNRFDVGGRTTNATVDGSGGVDTIVATRDADFTLTLNQLTITGGGVFALTAIENADLAGGASANTFDILAWAGAGVLSGLDGDDTFNFAEGDLDVITGGMTVDWEGERIPIPQLAKYLLDQNRDVRERAFRLQFQPYIEQRDALAKILDDTGRRGLMRVVMIHHPPTQGGAMALSSVLVVLNSLRLKGFGRR